MGARGTFGLGTPEGVDAPGHLSEYDRLFLEIFGRIAHRVIQITEGAVGEVMDTAHGFLDSSGKAALAGFYELYFSGREAEQGKLAVTSEIDDMVDSIRAQLESGVDPAALQLQSFEHSEAAGTRLTLAALQKRLETILTLETGIRDRIVPAMVSIQFEDFIKQMLTRLIRIWELVFSALHGGSMSEDQLKEKILTSIRTPAERDHFYGIVLKTSPPAAPENRDPRGWTDKLT